MKNIDLRYNTNNTVAEKIFNELLVWVAEKQPSLSKEQFIGDIEQILDKVEEKGYDRAKNSCCGRN